MSCDCEHPGGSRDEVAEDTSDTWHIYLHLTLKLPKCREIGHTLSIWDRDFLDHPKLGDSYLKAKIGVGFAYQWAPNYKWSIHSL